MSNITMDYGITLPADFLEPVSYTEYSPESFFDYEDAANPEAKEQILWRSVICQAILDATSIPTNSIARKEKTKSIIWFSMQNKDFLFVCEMAGMNPSFVMSQAKKFIKNSAVINKRKRYLKRARKSRYIKKIADKLQLKQAS